MAKHWHIENVEYRMSYLMQSGEEKLSDCCIGCREPVGIILVWQGSEYVLQKLVTYRHCRLEIFPSIPGVDGLALCRLDRQRFRRAEGPQYLSDTLQGMTLPQEIV